MYSSGLVYVCVRMVVYVHVYYNLTPFLYLIAKYSIVYVLTRRTCLIDPPKPILCPFDLGNP